MTRNYVSIHRRVSNVLARSMPTPIDAREYSHAVRCALPVRRTRSSTQRRRLMEIFQSAFRERLNRSNGGDIREPNFFIQKNKGEKERDICVNQTKYDDDTDDKVRCMCACVCVHDGPPRRSRSPAARAKTYLSFSSLLKRTPLGGGRKKTFQSIRGRA